MAQDILTYLECHAVRHDWEETSFLKAPSMGVAFDWHCVNCHGTKRELFSRNGVFISRTYRLPTDYRGPVGTTKTDYRRVWIAEKLAKQRGLKAV